MDELSLRLLQQTPDFFQFYHMLQKWACKCSLVCRSIPFKNVLIAQASYCLIVFYKIWDCKNDEDHSS